MATDTKGDILDKIQPPKPPFERDQQWELDFTEILSSVLQAHEVSSADRESAFEPPEASRSVTFYMPQTTQPTRARTVLSKLSATPSLPDPLGEEETDVPQSIGKFLPGSSDTHAYPTHRLAAGSSHGGVAIVPVGGLRPKYHRILSNVDLLTALSKAQAAATARNQTISPTPADRVKFRRLASQWMHDTEGISIHSRAIMHRAYQQIIGMGATAIPLLLEALRDQPDHWMWALSVLSDEDPARNARTFTQARAAWLHWGAEKGYLGD